MYNVEWDEETGGVILCTKVTKDTLGSCPRPVFFEELDLLGLDKLGWSYPRVAAPIMWAVNRQYFYRGQRIFEAKGANLCSLPVLSFDRYEKSKKLEPVDVEIMLNKNADLLFALESEAIEFIRDTYSTYAKVNLAYEKEPANKLDFVAMAEREEKISKRKMAVVRQSCDSFDIMPLEEAKTAGKKVLLSTRIDRFIASFSGGKDSQVLLDLCTRAIPPAAFDVIYSDTGYELPPSLDLYKDVQKYYNAKFPDLQFLTARNHDSVLKYWDKIGTPSDNHRWCCSVMKTAPLYRMLKTKGNKQAKVLAFDGVRAEESTRREGYQRIGKGKHTFVFNAHPIFLWNAVEVYLYLFRHALPINVAYRYGKARVGCLVCPFATTWDDMVVNHTMRDDIEPFISRINKYAQQAKIVDVSQYITDRKWKTKPLADREQTFPTVEIKSRQQEAVYHAEIKNARLSIESWLPALCSYTINRQKNKTSGELNFRKNVYPYEVKLSGNVTIFKVYNSPSRDLELLLNRLVYKTAYCINCEVCEVDCPTGALSVVPSVKIDQSKCIHCHKCYLSHDRGCIAADCTRMITDSERKINTKVQGYKTFGLRDLWVEEFFIDPDDFWANNNLGTAQVDSIKVWLRDAEITDNKNKITPMGLLLRDIYQNNRTLFWEIIYINLSYNSFIVGWVCQNTTVGTIYNKQFIKEGVLNQGISASSSTIENAAAAYVNMIKNSPLGEELMQGIPEGRTGLKRESYDDLSMEALAYSVYKFAGSKETNMFRVSDLYRPEEEHGAYKEFRISKEALLKKLRALTSDRNRVLTADLVMGLDHITVRDDLSVIELIALFV